MSVELNYDYVKARFDALNPTQKNNVHARLRALRSRGRIARVHYLSALDSMIQLETTATNPPMPEPCPTADRPDVFAAKMKDAKIATCEQGGAGINWV